VLRPEVAVGATLLGCLAYKIKLMEPAATGPLALAVVKHDAGIFALIGVLYLITAGIRLWMPKGGGLLSKVCLVTAGGCVLVYSADVFAYFFFNTRLYASDLITFAPEISGTLSLLRTGFHVVFGLPIWKLGIILLLAVWVTRAWYLLLFRPVVFPFRFRWGAAGFVILFGIYYVSLPMYAYGFGDKPLYENVIERNRNFFVNSNFSQAFRDRLALEPREALRKLPGEQKRINVLLVIVESLSAYHSHFFSGVENWTPRLDAIAQSETALTNFHANGWTTIGGLLSLLGRTFPFVPEQTEFNEWGSPRLMDFLKLPRPLAQSLVTEGYSTEFIAAGDLGFLDQELWLKDVGFRKLIGHDDPRYDGQKVRGPFKSVPDRLLFRVALDELAHQPADRPYFVVIQTYWSHRPFMAVDGGKVDGEEPVIRETDAAIGMLYDSLMASGFFANGVLFITGDHRAMEPLHKAEFDRFGSSAVDRIPGVIVTKALSLPHLIDSDFQQHDFASSVESIVLDTYSLGSQEGTFLSSPPIPPSTILHARADDRDLIDVKAGKEQGVIRVDGDNTKLIAGSFANEKSLIQLVNLTRIRPAMAEHGPPVDSTGP
jgi:lipoteichoic acid synthase